MCPSESFSNGLMADGNGSEIINVIVQEFLFLCRVELAAAAGYISRREEEIKRAR